MSKQSLNRRDVLRTLAAGGASTIVAGSVGLSPAAAADPDPVLAKAPGPVQKAVGRILNGVKWTAVHKVAGKGGVVYDLEGRENGREVNAEVTADGKVTGVDRGVSPAALPKPVLKAVTDKFPNFKVEHAEEVFEGDDLKALSEDTLSYEIEGRTQQGHEATISLLPDGTVTTVKAEVDAKAVPKIVADALRKKAPKFAYVSIHKLEEDGQVAGYLFTGDPKKNKKEQVFFVSKDGKDVEPYHED